MKKQKLLLGALLLCASLSLPAQTYIHERSKNYVYPSDTLVQKKLDKWQDLKFGMLIHFGLYSQMGICESWPICSEDWVSRDSTMTYDQCKKKYWSTINTFKPEKLDPESWAKYGKQAGIKYVIFSTKHHDGFNMFDTKYSDFSITKGAFKDNPRRNVAKEVFNAFRQQGYMIGAYYSKPDWHSQYYWWDKYATPDRNNNYDIRTNPWRWNQFKNFVYNQIQELMNGDYGKMDILWLDGGWVCPSDDAREKMMGRAYKGSQDIDMPRIAAMARKYQPGLLVVDRTVEGKYENYQTPEQAIPKVQLTNPWESCLTLANNWGYVPSDHFKSSATVIHKLIEIVAKGGNLLLGVGPKPDGTLPKEAEERLTEIGQWVNKNGKAIYNTRNANIYNDGDTWFTAAKDGKTIYALVCLKEGQPLPKTITWKGNEPVKGSKIRFVENGKTVKWKKTKDGIQVSVPAHLPATQPALAFSLQIKK